MDSQKQPIGPPFSPFLSSLSFRQLFTKKKKKKKKKNGGENKPNEINRTPQTQFITEIEKKKNEIGVPPYGGVKVLSEKDLFLFDLITVIVKMFDRKKGRISRKKLKSLRLRY